MWFTIQAFLTPVAKEIKRKSKLHLQEEITFFKEKLHFTNFALKAHVIVK